MAPLSMTLSDLGHDFKAAVFFEIKIYVKTMQDTTIVTIEH